MIALQILGIVGLTIGGLCCFVPVPWKYNFVSYKKEGDIEIIVTQHLSLVGLSAGKQQEWRRSWGRTNWYNSEGYVSGPEGNTRAEDYIESRKLFVEE